MKIREKSTLFQDYIRKAKGSIETFDALKFSKKKKLFENAIKLVSQDLQKCGDDYKNYGDLLRLKYEFERELESLVEGVKSSEGSGAMSEGSLRTAGELDDSRDRNRLRKE